VLISVVIPAYNEDRCIRTAIQSVYDFFSSKNSFSLELIVVDDCSADQTALIVEGLKENYPSLVYMRNERNMGKGFSVKRGIMESRGDYVLFMDADLSTPLGQFDILWKSVADHDVVIGSRALADSVIVCHQPWFKECVARLGNRVIRLFLRLPFHDTQCGFKLFSRRVVSQVFVLQTIERWGFDMEILFIVSRQGFRIAEVPVRWSNDPTSLVKKVDYFIVLFDVFKILTNSACGRYNKTV